MKFLNIIDSYKKKNILEEQGGDAPPPDATPPGAAPAGDNAAPAVPAAAAPANENKPDIPASVVRLSRLLKQALIIKMSDDDIDFISNLPEINENNAIEIVQQMTPVMKKYSNIDTGQGTGQE